MAKRSRVIHALFMCAISLIFTSLCVSFAWFAFPRTVDSSSTNIRLVGLTGDLYYYEGNYSVIQGSKDWGGFLGSEKQVAATKDDGTIKDFVKYDPNDTSIRPLVMSSAKPSSRFLFYIKAKLTNDSTANLRLNVIDWVNGGAIKDMTGGGKVYLSNAIYMYAPDTITLLPDQNADETNEAYDARIKPLAREAAINNFADTLTVASSSDANYAKNKFVNTNTANNQDGSGNLKDPINIGGPYAVTPSKYYLVPFMLEYTNHEATYFKKENAGTFTKWVSPSEAEKKYYSSNVYRDMEFTIKTLELTCLEPVQK